jgi:hypothetical protein
MFAAGMISAVAHIEQNETPTYPSRLMVAQIPPENLRAASARAKMPVSLIWC